VVLPPTGFCGYSIAQTHFTVEGLPAGEFPISVFVSGVGYYTGARLTIEPTEPVEIANRNIPAGGYALSSSSETELEDLATTIDVGTQCEVFATVALRVACSGSSSTLQLRLATSDAPEIVETFHVGDANNLTSLELRAAYSSLSPGPHTFRVFLTHCTSNTLVPSGSLGISAR
jgi:hypothetical protein